MSHRLIALSGGVGGAKLAYGLSRLTAPEELLIVANTGDDFEHLGLHVSPDVDSLTYALADLDDPVRGWGRRDETWNFMEAMKEIGGETWFSLGDRDLALHVERSRRLRAGETLSEVTARLCHLLGIGARVLPMSDDPVRTTLLTDAGPLDFQDYFVRLRCEPEVRGVTFAGAAEATAPAPLLEALADPELRGVVICPSNPFISIDPILAIPGIRQALVSCPAPVVAVSPIIAGAAVKGPAGKMLRELGLVPSAEAVATHYQGLLQGFLHDERDGGGGSYAVPARAADTLMREPEDRKRVARAVLEMLDDLKRRQGKAKPS